MKKENVGIIQMIVSAVLWSIAGVFMKLLPWSGFAVAGIRSFIAGLTIAAYMLIRKVRFTLGRSTLLGGAICAGMYTCFAVSNKLTTAANAIVLQYMAPVFIILFSAVFFHQKIRKWDILVVLVVIAGTALFFFDRLGPSTAAGNVVAIVSGILMAGMFVVFEKLDKEERVSAVLIGQILTFLAGIPAVIVTRPVLDRVTVPVVLILGIFQLGLAYIIYTKAAETCPALACCLLGVVEPVLNPVWVMIFNGEKPGIYAFAGGIVLLVSVTAWNVWDGKTRERQETPGPGEE